MKFAIFNYFTQPSILQQIGHRRLASLLRPFEPDLKTSGLVLPNPDTGNANYFTELAAILALPQLLPASLRQALFTIEAAASPENEMPIWRAIHHRIPGISVSQDCPLDRTLELWFKVPDELSQFSSPPSSDPPASGSPPRPNEGRIYSPAFTDSITPPVKNANPPIPPAIANPPVQVVNESQPTAPADSTIQQLNDSTPPLPPNSTIQLFNASAAHLPQDSTSPPALDSTPPLAPDSTVQLFNGSTAPLPNDSTSPETDEQTFNRLATLSPAQYDRTRKAEATRLGIRLETLDAEVAKSRTELGYDAEARAIQLPPIEPWPEPVDGAEVLGQVSERFTLHVFLPPGAADAITLWDTHAHAFQAFLHSPRLNLTSPEKGCGKTTTLDLLATMTPRAMRSETLTAPVLFRVMDQHQPTLLLDEVDSYLHRSEELRGLLNAGHKQGACAYRCAGGGNAIRAFKAFGPAVLSGIGPLPDTLDDRSIRIMLTKVEPEQLAARFDSRKKDIETVLCRKLARWTQDNFALLQACDPAMPATAYNRVADNWRPMFAIAQIAGGDWPRRALEAYNHLTTQRVPEHSALPTPNSQLTIHNSQLLLADLRQIFTQSGATRLSSKQLLEALQRLPSGHYSGLGTPHYACKWLARTLNPLGIKPHTLRIGNMRVTGYDLSEFTEAFSGLDQPESQEGG